MLLEGLAAQNRALDGDTVIIQLLAPGKWPAMENAHLVISGNQAPRITNETPVETRIIDVERGGTSMVETEQAPINRSVSTEEAKVSPVKNHHEPVICE